jgi:hypothetical protein
MNSLTSFLPLLMPHLGITQAAIYERQRALIRLGLLPKPTGRGRGSGATATPRAAALICLSVLVTDNLSEMDSRVSALAQARIETWRKRKRCGLTGATTLVEALSAILADYNLASRTRSIRVERKSLEGDIFWTQAKSKNLEVSQFRYRELRLIERSSLTINASLDGSALRQVAAALAAEGTIQ